jgi:hypothetical protein
MSTARFAFFHGTSGKAAKSILTDGVGDAIYFRQARELVHSIWPLIQIKLAHLLRQPVSFNRREVLTLQARQ